MAAAVQEMQRLLVRLTGDGTQYASMLKKAERQTKTYVDKAGRVHDVLTRKFVSNTRKMQLQLNMLGQTMIAAGQKATAFGRTMSLRLTAPIVLLGTLAARSFAKFDSAMTQSIAIMDVTASQIERMTNLAREMSASGQVLQGADELGRSYFFLASAGLDAEQSMALMQQTMDFATAGMFDAAVATDLATDAMSALGLMTDDTAQLQINYAKVTDMLVKGNTLANASVEQIARSLVTKAGAAMKVYNKDLAEGEAVLLAWADQGVKGELAGNAFDRILRLMSKSAIENTKAHKALGFQVFDSTGKMRNMADIIGNLEDVLRGMSDEQRAVALDMMGFEARVQGVLLPLIGTSKAIRKYEKELRNAGGTTKKVADEQMKSFSARMKVVWNQIKGMAISIGKTLEPAISFLGTAIGELARWFTRWPGWIKAVVVSIVALLAIIGPLLIALGSMMRLIGFVGIGLSTLTTKLGISRMAILSWKAAWVSVITAGVLIFLAAVASHAEKARAEIRRLKEERISDRRLEEKARTGTRKILSERDRELEKFTPLQLVDKEIKRQTKQRLAVIKQVEIARERLGALKAISEHQPFRGKHIKTEGLPGGKIVSVPEEVFAQARERLKAEKELLTPLQSEIEELLERRRKIIEEFDRQFQRKQVTKGVVGAIQELQAEAKIQSLKALEEQFGGPGGPLARFGRMGTQGAGGLIAQMTGSTTDILMEGKRAGKAFADGFFSMIKPDEIAPIQDMLAFGGMGKKATRGAPADFSGMQVARAGSAEMLSRIVSSRAGGEPAEEALNLMEKWDKDGIMVNFGNLALEGLGLDEGAL